MKTALVCGGGGFIGGHLINRLKKEGYFVRGVDLKENEYGNDKADEFVLSGDVLFQRSIGRTDLPGGNFDTLIVSIRSQLFTLPDNTKVYSGHGDATFIGVEKRENPFLKAHN